MAKPGNRKKRNFTIAQARTLWESNKPTKEVAEELGITVAALQKFAEANAFAPRPETAKQWKNQHTASADPTPEEILSLAAELRAKRPAAEHEKMYQFNKVVLKQYAYNGRQHVFSEM